MFNSLRYVRIYLFETFSILFFDHQVQNLTGCIKPDRMRSCPMYSIQEILIENDVVVECE